MIDRLKHASADNFNVSIYIFRKSNMPKTRQKTNAENKNENPDTTTPNLDISSIKNPDKLLVSELKNYLSAIDKERYSSDNLKCYRKPALQNMLTQEIDKLSRSQNDSALGQSLFMEQSKKENEVVREATQNSKQTSSENEKTETDKKQNESTEIPKPENNETPENAVESEKKIWILE